MVFAACHTGGGEIATPDAPVDGTGVGSDGTQPALGMFVTWRANPPLPGTVTDKVAIADATFQLDHFQVVGDAGGDATTHTKYLLAWNATTKPAQERFPQAPVGVYSKVSLVMAIGNLAPNAYEIHGTWTDSNSPAKPFVVRDLASLATSVDCDEMLPAAGMASIALRVDLRDALNGINFKLLEEEDGELELKEGPQLVEFRTRLQRAFKLDDD